VSATPNTPQYTEFHPRWHRVRVSTYWWLGSWRYLKFILRELSSIAVALGVGMTLLQIYALRSGPRAYDGMQAWLQNPLVLIVAAVTFLFVLFHAITWFNLAPKAMAVRLGGTRLPDIAIAAPNFIAWAIVSAVVAWFVLRS